jgi:hypothetical protein
MHKKSLVWVGGLLLALVILLRGPAGLAAQTPDLFINEILVGNATTNLDTDYYEYSSWIEIYNGRATSVDLKGYALAYVEEDAAPLEWKVSSSLTVPANGRVLLWADEQNKGAHTNFKLDMRGETISLLDPSRAVVDSVTYDMRDKKTLLPDVSYGRAGDGASAWVYFDQPTPAGPNTTPGFAASTIAEPPQFSPPGGFYPTGQTVTLSTTESNGVIRYTKDGSTPTAASRAYEGPITVSDTMVIRARVFTPDKLDSQTGTHTYLINVSRNLPVVSLATNPEHLFDDMIGIYVIGKNGLPAGCLGGQRANFNQPWERPVSMEMVEPDGRRVVAQDIGFEIMGGFTRCKDRKSLELKARRTYGDNDIDYAALPDKPIDSYKRLVLRNAGGDAYGALFRDALQQYLVKDTMDIDYQAYRPVVVYINGAYWGIHNLRDKADEAFVEQNYDLDADADFDMIKNGRVVEAGDLDAWNALYTFISKNDLRVQANYDYVVSQIDLDEFMNYFITEIYVNNTDWPHNNIRFWRARDNGRWRWVLHDTDHGFLTSMVNKPYLSYMLTCGVCNANSRASREMVPLRKLMQNTAFKQEFSQRFASHIAITFAPARVNEMIDWFKAGIEPEMPAHIARWRKPSSLASWNSQIDGLRLFGNQRPAVMLNDLNANLGRPGTAALTVNINGGGDVLAAGVQVPGSGFQGDYFKNTPLTLEAVARPGAQFVRWQETNETTPVITVTLGGAMTRTAVFAEAAIPKIVINEIHYNPADAQGLDDDYEFVELINAGAARVNLAGFQITGAFDFTFPAGAKIEAGEIILLAKNGSTYAGQGYQVFAWGDGGSLKNSSARIALLDGSGGLVDEVTYSDSAPWPTAPDGNGPALALLDPVLDNSLAASWAPSPVNGGSPGAANPSGPPQPAALTIVSQVTGATPAGDWAFSGSLEAFTLPAAGGQRAFTDLAPGGYTVAQTAVPGYTTAVSCTDGASGTGSVTVTLGSGADVTCTFVNTEATGGIPPQGHCSPPVAGNVIQNPGFESGGAEWFFHTDKKATFNVVSTPAAGADPYECSSSARVAIGTPGKNVQLHQRGFPLKADTTYTLRLAARSSGGEDIQVVLHRNSAPYTNYGLNSRTKFNLTPEWQVFEVEFRTRGFSSATTDTRLRLWLAPYDKAGTVYEFDDIVLTEK